MGVKISDLVKPVLKEITIKTMINKKIAIDAFNVIYQFLSTIRQLDGTPLKDYKGNVTSHLSGLFYRTLNLIENDIKPVFVFDGPPIDLKLNTIKERRENRESAKIKMEDAQDAQDDVDAKKFAQATSKLDKNMISESKELLEHMGVPWVEASHDGEAEAAQMVNSGDVWASASQDYDSLLFGAKRLVRNLNVNPTRKVKNTIVKVQIEFYSLDKVLEHLNFDRKQLVDMGILIGTDFFKGITGVGEKTAYNLIQKYGSIDSIIQNKVEIKKIPIMIQQDLLDKVRGIFLNIDRPKNKIKLKWKSPNENGIRDLLHERHNFNLKRLDSSIERLSRKNPKKSNLHLIPSSE